MNTSQDAINRLELALKETREAETIIKDLVAPHAYQDVALLAVQSANKLLLTAYQFMQTKDEEALDELDSAEDFIESIYDIIEGDLE